MISCCYHTVECQRNRNRVDVGMTKAMTEKVVRLNCGDRLSDTNCGVGLVRAPTTGKYCTERRICYIFPPCSIRGVVGLLEGSLLFLNRIPIRIQPLFTPSKKPPRYTWRCKSGGCDWPEVGSDQVDRCLNETEMTISKFLTDTRLTEFSNSLELVVWDWCGNHDTLHDTVTHQSHPNLENMLQGTTVIFKKVLSIE